MLEKCSLCGKETDYFPLDVRVSDKKVYRVCIYCQGKVKRFFEDDWFCVACGEKMRGLTHNDK